MKFCPQCGYSLLEQEAFCPQCGAACAAPPPSPMNTPPVYTAPRVSPLVNDLKACAVGLIASVVYLVLAAVLCFSNELNYWLMIVSYLLSGGALASVVFAAVHCEKACAWISTLPWVAVQILSLSALLTSSDIYSNSLVPSYLPRYITGYALYIAVPLLVVLIVGIWRKRRPTAVVQPMSMLLMFGLLSSVQMLTTLFFDVFPMMSEGYMEWYYYVNLLSCSIGLTEIVGFAAIYAVSWLLLKQQKQPVQQ